jgi:hypothetical protein
MTTKPISNKQLLEGLLDEESLKKDLVKELFGIGDSPMKKILSKVDRMHKELAAMSLDLEQEAIESDSIKVLYKAMDALEQLKAKLELDLNQPISSRTAFPGGLNKKGKEIPGWKPSGEPGIHGGGFPFNPGRFK